MNRRFYDICCLESPSWSQPLVGGQWVPRKHGTGRSPRGIVYSLGMWSCQLTAAQQAALKPTALGGCEARASCLDSQTRPSSSFLQEKENQSDCLLPILGSLPFPDEKTMVK